MMAWTRAIVVLALLASVARCSSPEPTREGPHGRHVFFIVIDTLRADHLGTYGYERGTSPTIDRLAQGGVVFENAFANASSTLESVYSFFTSTTAVNELVYVEGLPLWGSPLHKCFERGGHQTLAVIANPWLHGVEFFFDNGFENLEFINLNDQWVDNSTERVTEAVLDKLENDLDPLKDSFFYIHYLDPHDRYLPPRDYGFALADRPAKRPTTHWLSGEPDVDRRLQADPAFAGIATPRAATAELLDHLVADYDGEIRYVDENLRRIVDKLEDLEILEDSVLVITADHGEEFLEHGCLKHGFQLYDETLRIPLIVYAPELLAPARRQDLVSGIDIPVTLLTLAGLPIPEHMLGRDILADRLEQAPVLVSTHFKNQEQHGMRSERWKLIENLKTARCRSSTCGTIRPS